MERKKLTRRGFLALGMGTALGASVGNLSAAGRDARLVRLAEAKSASSATYRGVLLGAAQSGENFSTSIITSGPITLVFMGQSWTLSSEQLGQMLRWKNTGPSWMPYLDTNELRDWVVNDIASQIDSDQPTDAYLSAWENGSYKGKIFIVPDSPAIQVNPAQTASVIQNLALSPTDRTGEVKANVTQARITADDLKQPLKRAHQLTSQRLYMKLGKSKWWLDPADLVKASKWTDGQGANTKVWLSVDLMVDEIMRFVPYDTGAHLVNFIKTARDGIRALNSGQHSIPMATVSRPSGKGEHARPPHEGEPEVWGGNPPGRWIDINLSSQTMAAYSGENQVRTTYVTTGNYQYPSRRTPTGIFNIMAKLSPYTFISPFPKKSKFYYPPSKCKYAMRFREGGYYIHDAPWRGRFGPWTNMAKDTPGSDRTGSHGCVNTPPEMMDWLWKWTDEGTSVVVHY